MCCTVGCPGPVLAPVAGRKTVFELDITAAAAAPAEDGFMYKNAWEKEAAEQISRSAYRSL